MTDISDDIERPGQRAKAAAKKVTDEGRDEGESVVDQTRQVAQEIFEKIKAARKRAAKMVD
jgi:uncharacterized protein YoxC